MFKKVLAVTVRIQPLLFLCSIETSRSELSYLWHGTQTIVDSNFTEQMGR